jgi:hypothetical protein
MEELAVAGPTAETPQDVPQASADTGPTQVQADRIQQAVEAAEIGNTAPLEEIITNAADAISAAGEQAQSVIESVMSRVQDAAHSAAGANNADPSANTGSFARGVEIMEQALDSAMSNVGSFTGAATGATTPLTQEQAAEAAAHVEADVSRTAPAANPQF